MVPISLPPNLRQKRILALHSDVGGAITAGIVHLMGSSRASRLLAEINIEMLVDLQSTILRVTINLQHVGPRFRQFRIKLVIPRTVQRVRDVQPLPIQTQLQHLRSTMELVPLDIATLAQQATAPHLARQPGMRGITDIILANITMQPV